MGRSWMDYRGWPGGVDPMILLPWDHHLIEKKDIGPLVSLIRSLPLRVTVAVDTETTGLHPYENDRLMGVSFAWAWNSEGGPMPPAHRSFYVPVGHEKNAQGISPNISEFDLGVIFKELMARDPYIIMHNGAFDLAFLQQLPRAGHGGPFFTANNWDYDTLVVSWLHDENVKHGLKDLAAMLWGDEEKDAQRAIRALIKECGGWDKLQPEDIATYAAKDAEQTHRLYQHQISHQPKYGTVNPEIIEREMAVARMTYRMIQMGVFVDVEKLGKQLIEAESEVADLEALFAERYELNVNSPKQLSEFLFDKLGFPCLHETPSGARSVNRAALEELEHMASTEEQEHLIEKVLRHRRIKKAVSTYYIPIADRIGRDGRVHPSFKTTGTVTGRFSCSDPNLQTIPRGDTLAGVRDIFVAEDGFELWEYDLAAAELRVMAGWARDLRMIAQLKEGRDMHSENAAEIFGPAFTPLQRRTAKNIFYGWCYEIGPKKAASYMVQGEPVTEAHVAQAAAVLKGYNRLYPRIATLKKHFAEWAKREKFIPLHVEGRYRRFHSPGVVVPAYTALNACVQGGIGEAMKDCMLLAEPHLDREGARLCLQVHDSLVIELLPGWGEHVRQILQSCMDSIDPFPYPMEWTAAPWASHE